MPWLNATITFSTAFARRKFLLEGHIALDHLYPVPAAPSHTVPARTNGPAAPLFGDQISRIAPKNIKYGPAAPFF